MEGPCACSLPRWVVSMRPPEVIFVYTWFVLLNDLADVSPEHTGVWVKLLSLHVLINFFNFSPSPCLLNIFNVGWCVIMMYKWAQSSHFLHYGHIILDLLGNSVSLMKLWILARQNFKHTIILFSFWIWLQYVSHRVLFCGSLALFQVIHRISIDGYLRRHEHLVHSIAGVSP